MGVLLSISHKMAEQMPRRPRRNHSVAFKAKVALAQLRHQLPQSRVLIPQLLGRLRFSHIHAAILRLPRLDRVLRHTILPRHIHDLI